MVYVADVKDYGEIQPEKELKFVFKPKSQVSCTVKLTNKSNLYHMAFKLRTTRAKLYSVKPRAGLIKPFETCEIVITRKFRRVMPLPCEIAKEKISIRRLLLVPEDTFISEDNMIAAIFTSEDWKKHIDKKKLKVVMTITTTTGDHDCCPTVPVINIAKIGARLGDVEERIRLGEKQRNYCSSSDQKKSATKDEKHMVKLVMIDGKPTIAVNIKKFAARLDAVEDRLREVQEINCCCEKKKTTTKHSSFFTRCFNIQQ
uniref:vesicle-associated protein 2-2-like n=1 Tax=Erigeron canadensis TaxID=72917 RepID=UPI001CB9321C|nr:vesicle-associated protein 2-2-like [Erigeron canadensis]